MNIRPTTLTAAAVLGLLNLAVLPAQAGLVLQATDGLTGARLGTAHTLLTLHGPDTASDTWGGVGVNAWTRSDVITGQALTGPAQTMTRTLGELGVNSASALRVVFSADEPTSALQRGIALESLVLNIYSPVGELLFTSGAFMPMKFPDVASRAGHAAHVFALDGLLLAEAQAAAFGAGFENNVVGLSAMVLSAEGGAETFFVGSSPVPEPESWALALAGLAALALVRRRGQAQPCVCSNSRSQSTSA